MSESFSWWQSGQSSNPFLGKAVVLTIGNFDGVHLGHQQLLRQNRELAKKHGALSVLMTFEPHPAAFLFPEKGHYRLFDREDQKNVLQRLGMDGVFVQSFTRDFSELSPEAFMQKYFLQEFSVKGLVVGHDFSFGRDRRGSAGDLKKFCATHGIEFAQMEAFQRDGDVVSTSRIRKSLQEGQPDVAYELLGRPYFLRGVVVKGDQRGRLLGFPTANLRASVDFHPRLGVYQTQALLDGKVYPSITNIGTNRTFKEGDLQPIKIETHLLDFSADIYGKKLQVNFLKYLRPERKFNSFAELKAQIEKDVEQVRGALD
ncbi:MAG: bifunctional riboflavin kinase/FAD synthetase [Proteobacteria bacterium]|jgi:riboflavin kinase/FMN adenylyltransferase|nr:bifunctional riboflavin kinase/FAD synthetase [Pseudomonadota bacterium]